MKNGIKFNVNETDFDSFMEASDDMEPVFYLIFANEIDENKNYISATIEDEDHDMILASLKVQDFSPFDVKGRAVLYTTTLGFAQKMIKNGIKELCRKNDHDIKFDFVKSNNELTGIVQFVIV